MSASTSNIGGSARAYGARGSYRPPMSALHPSSAPNFQPDLTKMSALAPNIRPKFREFASVLAPDIYPKFRGS